MVHFFYQNVAMTLYKKRLDIFFRPAIMLVFILNLKLWFHSAMISAMRSYAFADLLNAAAVNFRLSIGILSI
jgi:hypothetical protein